METVTPSVISVKAGDFEGPLELLIELVEKRKLLINSISLAAVTDEYMERVRAMQEQSLPHTAQFIALAATLLLIKSKSLLPALDLTVEEEASIDDLEARLRVYQVVREIADTIQAQYGTAVMYEPEYQPKPDPVFVPDRLCTKTELAQALADVIANLPAPVEKKPTAAIKQAISLEQMMDDLQRRIAQHLKFTFSQLQAETSEHKTVIVGFLAILELFKQGDLHIHQEARFADIEVEQQRFDTPKYY